ncbi:MAG: sugar phosphate nucleotidyltransferase [Candidatus Paceibacterota bacterium]
MNQAIILTAGESSRFWPLNSKHKTLFRIMGKPLVYYTIESLRKAGIKDIIIVQGPARQAEEELKDFNFNGVNIKYAIQPEPKGMGNALLYAKDYLQDNFFVLNAERFDAGDYVKLVLEKQKATNSKLVLLGAETSNPQLYGIMDVDGDKIKGVVEKPEKGKEPSNIKIVGVYFLPKDFFSYYEKIQEHMYAFEEAIDAYVKDNDSKFVMTDKETLPLKYPWHILNISKYLMDNYLEKKISKTAKIAKNVIIEGKVFIGENVKIFENAVIKGPCYVGDNSVVGNNAIVRDYVNLEQDSIAGANLEITRTIFESNVHAHSGFIGDSVVGKGCRIGAGTITANVKVDRGDITATVKGEKIKTGMHSLGLMMGENSKMGIHCSLMPGKMIGSDCLIGPNSLVLKNIENKTEFFEEIDKRK